MPRLRKSFGPHVPVETRHRAAGSAAGASRSDHAASPDTAPIQAAYAAFSSLSPMDRIRMIRHGIAASTIGLLAERLQVGKLELVEHLGLSITAISIKERDRIPLSPDETERVMTVATLINLVQQLVEDSGEPAGFDAADWLGAWLFEEEQELGGLLPASLLDTFEGRDLLKNLLLTAQSGAYL